MSSIGTSRRGREGRDSFEQATHTRALVEFHSDQHPNKEKIVIGSGTGPDARLGHLVSVQTRKGFDSVAGTFAITIKKPVALQTPSTLHIWTEPEDVWVKIYWIVEGQQFHVMTGLIDSVNERSMRQPDGKRVEIVTIQGRDVGKIFESVETWTNIYALQDGNRTTLRGIGAALDLLKGKLAGTPAKFIRTLIEVWIGNNGLAEHQWQAPNSIGYNSFFEMLSLANLQQMDDGNGRLFDPTLLARVLPPNSGGKLWDMLSDYSNDILNEMWVDLNAEENSEADLLPAIFLRERPFPTRLSGRDKWNSIRIHHLNREDVQNRSVSKGGSAQLFNFWLLSIDGSVIGMDERALIQSAKIDGVVQGKPGSIPIWNPTSIMKHGIRKWERSTKFLNFLEKTAWFQVAANWLRRIHDWYSVAPMQVSGTLDLTRLFPEIRIGQRVLERRSEGDLEFYVEGVEHRWSYPNAGKTMLTVTRGEYISGFPLLAVVYEELENREVLTNRQACMIADKDVTFENTLKSIQNNCKFITAEASVDDENADFFGFGEADELFAEFREGTEALSLGIEGGVLKEDGQQDASMIPSGDVENAQARELTTNPNAAVVVRTPSDQFFIDELIGGEDPLAVTETTDGLDPLEGFVQ